jgi:hypothetical protein
MRWSWIGFACGIACAGEEPHRADPNAFHDPYAGGGETEPAAPIGTEPTEPAPEADDVERGAELDGRSGVLVLRGHTEACSTEAERQGRPDLDVVMEALGPSQDAIQRCYEDARVQHDPGNAGLAVDVQATFGENGCLERTIIADDGVLTPQFTMCVANVAKGWSIPAYANRSQHRFSLELHPQ